jgi:hypothetical protein
MFRGLFLWTEIHADNYTCLEGLVWIDKFSSFFGVGR